MPGLVPDVDPDGLLEYSVVYSDRALNHMSAAFRSVMTDLSRALRRAYGADGLVIVPGSGTFAMEAVARQFATDRRCLVIRNGWFSYRWSQILATGRIPSHETVCRARSSLPGPHAPFAPPPLEEVVAAIERERPEVVFAPHVETSAGMLLPDDYLRAVAAAVRARGGLFVLDCVASGALWVDLRRLGVDVLITAPQKGWSASPCCGLVLLGERALQQLETTTSSSFACDLRQWHRILQAYEQGGHAYHATMPTDGLRILRDRIAEAEAAGLEVLRARQVELGRRVRTALEVRGCHSVAAAGYQAPTVVVSYTDDDAIRSGAKFAAQGLQVAPGVPLQCGEPADFRTFRVGLFGLDKLAHVDRTVELLEQALDRLD